MIDGFTMIKTLITLLIPFLLAAGVAAQTTGSWTCEAGKETSSLHGSGGGVSETVKVTNHVSADGHASTVTMKVTYRIPGEDDGTYITEIPEGEARSFTGDIVSVVICGDATHYTSGSYVVT